MCTVEQLVLVHLCFDSDLSKRPGVCSFEVLIASHCYFYPSPVMRPFRICPYLGCQCFKFLATGFARIRLRPSRSGCGVCCVTSISWWPAWIAYFRYLSYNPGKIVLPSILYADLSTGTPSYKYKRVHHLNVEK